MAVLLGCDFNPAGVAGVGKESVLQLFQGWASHWDALKMLDFWIETDFSPASCNLCEIDGDDLHCSYCLKFRYKVSDGDCVCSRLTKNKKLSKVEASVKKKCLTLGQSWWRLDYPKILSEFLSREPLPADLSPYKSIGRPNVRACLSILTKKLTWVEEYAQLKVIPIVTRWQAEHLANSNGDGEQVMVVPIKILKKRTSAGVASLSVEWKAASSSFADDDLGLPETFESIVPASFIEHAYPKMYSQFVQSLIKPKKTAKGRCKKAAKASKENNETDAADTEISTQKSITNFFSQRRKPLLPSSSVAQNANKGVKISKSSEYIIQEYYEEPKPAAGLNIVVVEEEEEEEEENNVLSDDDDDPEELSFLVDQIVLGKKEEIKPRTLKRGSSPAFATSTPGCNRQSVTKTRPGMVWAEPVSSIAIKKQSVFKRLQTEKEEEDVIPDDFEDSFDRMCL